MDSVLNKEVPSIVFLQNQKMLTDAWIEGLEQDEVKKQEIVRNAQINEFMYTILKEEGVVMSIDENVGLQFVHVPIDPNRKTMDLLDKSPSTSVKSFERSISSDTSHDNRRKAAEFGYDNALSK